MSKTKKELLLGQSYWLGKPAWAGQSCSSVWSACGNAAANKSINKTAVIEAPMEVSWRAFVGSDDESHGYQPPLVISALAAQG